MKNKVCRICRRQEVKLYLKGQKCYTEKCPLINKSYPPGRHGKTKRVRKTNYLIRLREKQKLRKIYFMKERQFRRFFEKAQKVKGNTAGTLIQLLERRLDNILYRAGFSKSRRNARQIILHGHVIVNGRKVDKPSYTISPEEVIGFKDENNITPEQKTIPKWLEADPERKTVRVLRLPEMEDIDYDTNVSLVVEFYSR